MKNLTVLLLAVALFFNINNSNAQKAYPVVIGASVPEMVKNGQYSRLSQGMSITSLKNDYQIVNPGKEKTLYLFESKISFPVESILAEIDDKGFKPATAEDLFAFGKTYLNAPGDIVALASGFGESHACNVLCIHNDGEYGRALLHHCIGQGMENHYFLVEKK